MTFVCDDHPPACPPSCDHCLAFDNHSRQLCSKAPSKGSKWCADHEMLQAKLLKSYKRLTIALEAFDDSSLPPSLAAISSCTDMFQLRSWSESCRAKWGMGQRVVVARHDHHVQFYAGGDAGHCMFVETVKDESVRLEKHMRALDRQAYTVTLASSQAEWVLSAPAVDFICDEPVVETPPTPPATPPLAPASLPSDTPSLTKNQRKKAQRKARKGSNSSGDSPLSPLDSDCCADSSTKLRRHFTTSDRLDRLRAYLVPPPDLPSSIQPSTWTALVSHLFRHVVLRIPSLAPLALNDDKIDSVNAFLDLLEERMSLRCGEEVDRLWMGLKFAKSTTAKEDDPNEGFLGVGVLADAIGEVFRGDDDETHVKLMGGKVHKKASTEELPGEGWDLFYQFIGCAGCSLSVTRTYAAWVRNRRLALLGAYPAWLSPAETPAEHVFRLAGFALCSSNLSTSGKKVRRIEQKDSGGRGKKGKKAPVLVEDWERAWMYVKLPLHAPWTNEVLDLLASEPDRFAVLARNAETLEVTHSPPASPSCRSKSCNCCDGSDLWLAKVRSGLSPAERKAANWTTSTFFPVPTVLNSFTKNSSPEQRFGFNYTDVHDCLIMDARSYTASSSSTTTSEWLSFSNNVAELVMRAAGCETLGSLLARERHLARERGELVTPKSSTKEVKLGKGSGGMRYAAFEETLVARELFREDF